MGPAPGGARGHDELDGAPLGRGGGRVEFGFDGIRYEIVLSAENRRRLVALVRRWGGAGRRLAPDGTALPHGAEVRAWARDQGLPVAVRGRVADALVLRYHQEAR